MELSIENNILYMYIYIRGLLMFLEFVYFIAHGFYNLQYNATLQYYN